MNLATATMIYLTAIVSLFLVLSRGAAGEAETSLPQRKNLGSFFVDLQRTVVYILLPVALVTSVVFLQQGTPTTFYCFQQVPTLKPVAQGYTTDENDAPFRTRLYAKLNVPSRCSPGQPVTSRTAGFYRDRS